MNRKTMIKLAFADDHEIVRKSIIGHVEAAGNFRFIIEAANGAALIEQLTVARSLPDICLLDIFMPVKDGYETLREIRRYWPSMKILVLTGNTTEWYLTKMVMAGANGYLAKNCSPGELHAALEAIYRNGIHYSDTMTLRFVEEVRSGKASLPAITDEEAVFLQYCCSNLTYAQVAERMKLRQKQVEWLRTTTFRKFSAVSRTDLAMLAVQFGLVKVEPMSPLPSYS